MSRWTYVNGIVTVSPPGSGQRVRDFVIGEVVDHLPRVTGSEGDMHVEVVRRSGFDVSSNSDEFWNRSNLGSGGWFKGQSVYDLLLEGALRDREYMESLRELSEFMSRLSKRVRVEDVLVRICSRGRSMVFDGPGHWGENFEDWSWVAGEGFAPARSVRRSNGWRYGVGPSDGGNWCERLATLMPGGNIALTELDAASGNLEWFEYGQTVEEVQESIDGVSAFASDASDTLRMLRALKAELEDVGGE